MKPWRDLKSIAIPDCMKHLPLDARGYPIPHNVARRPDGTPDFRVVDQNKWAECVIKRLCALTGHPLGEEIAFVGGPMSIMQRAFTDSAMLPAAAEYAIQVCPFLAAPKFAYARDIKIDGQELAVNESVSTVRPERFGLGITRSYKLIKQGEDIIIVAAMFSSVRYFKHGIEQKELNWKKGTS